MSFIGVKRGRVGWWLLGVALAGALVFVVHSFVGTFVFGLFLYYATRPIYRRLRRRIRPPSLAAAVSLFALALPALLLVLYALALVFDQAVRYTNSGLVDLTQFPIDPELLSAITDPERLLELDPSSYLSAEVINRLTRSLASAFETFAFFGIGAVHLFVMIALAFYLLRDDRRLSDWALSTFGDSRGVVLAYGTAVDHDLKAIFFGNILNAVLTGTIGVIAYTVLNVFSPAPGVAVPAAALVGLLAGVASIIPVVGMKLVYVPVALYMAVVTFFVDPQLLWFVLVFAAVSFVVVDTIPDLVLRPYVSGRSLHVGSVMIAYTFGPLLFGWYGIFLMPMLLVLVFHFARIVLPELVKGRELQPFAVDPAVDNRSWEATPLEETTSGTVVSTGGEGHTGDETVEADTDDEMDDNAGRKEEETGERERAEAESEEEGEGDAENEDERGREGGGSAANADDDGH